MDWALDPAEIRVLGALVEKSLATPDGYPLTLAALTTACNQKSNREPVMSLAESEVQDALDRLIGQHLARERNTAGGRVPKYAHRLADSLGLSFGFSEQELGVLSVLMLRGPQTPGELRTRTSRLCRFADSAEVETVLQKLARAERGPYLRELARRPGHRESRWAQLFGGPVAEDAAPIGAASPAAPHAASDLEQRVGALEATVVELEEALDALRARLGDDG